MDTSATFTDIVVAAMRKLFPEELADKSWDNTGLLLGEAPRSSSAPNDERSTVLLTNDLTAEVVDEALKERARVIICYHPVIFKGIKSLTTQDPMQLQLLRLAAERISVYCPHSAVDAAVGGMCDWLCDILTMGGVHRQQVVCKALRPISGPIPQGQEGAGYGREMVLPQETDLHTLLRRLSAGTTGSPYVMVAMPERMKRPGQPPPMISKIAVCPGSGASVFGDTDADLLVTGEMSHHEALRHTQLGRVVATVFHSNSERRYLRDVLRPTLEKRLQGTPASGARIVVSSADRDPYEIINVQPLA
ncbi:hypothetical protein DL766_002285 [Monosporascus sp. MC13-8B]|uniref:Uncharacterized protein n=1 Tax=Monosporascus cannonballus TaxID=155416 RepID=A0ABY0H236_9PEZI|nr:hypothetical protein DL762_006406 [Monosporascus cannonballus]RYO86487.1 hypothetical protein DL763_006679 [Monosporascus cannonballus]RYP35884.1 hypothetical protein DL766_002285 [Monosporascus sp. MC13-8B]